MVVSTSALPALTQELELFHTTDPLLYNAPILVFYGPAATIVSASSRIQVHVFTPAGFESYTRLAISPSSPYYAAVNALPREEQGDEICRGIAFGLSKYFAEIPNDVKECWTKQASTNKRPASPFGLFSPTHVAVLASRMSRVQKAQGVIEDLQRALGEKNISWLDLDVVLPAGSIAELEEGADADDVTEEEICKRRYGKYADFISSLGDPAFLPTSKLKRAPSKATAVGRSQMFRKGQKEMVRKEMCELVDTEESYIQKLSQLVDEIARDVREKSNDDSVPVQSAEERAIDTLFPQSLGRMREVNGNFLAAIRTILDETEEAAIADIEREGTSDAPATPSAVKRSDDIGVTRFAKCLLEHLPHFAEDYPAYTAGHAQFSSLIKQLLKSPNTEIASTLQQFGEQRLTSMLIEPIQRLPRYTLYIDTISKLLPFGHPALKSLLKARDIVTEICSQDVSDDHQADVEKRLKRLVQGWPAELSDLGRLVTVADIVKLEPPYDPEQPNGRAGLALLFADALILLEKGNINVMNARGLQTELDKPSVPALSDAGRPQTPAGLQFGGAIGLDTALFTECLDGRAITIMRKRRSSDQDPPALPPAILLLEGPYSAKAIRLAEEISKARVEGRFSETEREGGRWDVRSALSGPEELNMFSAIFESDGKPRDRVANIQLIVDDKERAHAFKYKDDTRDGVLHMKYLSADTWQITVENKQGLLSRDRVPSEELATAVLRRCTILLSFVYILLTLCQ